MIVFDKPKSLTDAPLHYCPGCTHGIIHRLVAEAIDELGIEGRTIGVAPVGCAVMAYDYFACDMVEAAHGRAPAVATGIKRANPENIVFTEGDGEPFYVMPHSPEHPGDEQLNYIESLLTKADSAIYCIDKTSEQWEQYIDIDALAIYYIVQEVVDNHEAFSGSCYMYKERGDSSKLVFGPLWDCDHTYFRLTDINYGFNQYIYEDLPPKWFCRWIAEIVKFPHFQERVRFHWRRFYEEVYPTMDGYMDDFVARIERASNADFVRWPQYQVNNCTYRVNRYAKPSFHKKGEWLNTQWGQ